MHCFQLLNAFNYQVQLTATGEDYHVIWLNINYSGTGVYEKDWFCFICGFIYGCLPCFKFLYPVYLFIGYWPIGQPQRPSENENTYLLTFYLPPTMKVKLNFRVFAFENCDCSLLNGKAFSQNCFSIQQYTTEWSQICLESFRVRIGLKMS